MPAKFSPKRKLQSPRVHSSTFYIGNKLGKGHQWSSRSVNEAVITDPTGKIFTGAVKRSPYQIDEGLVKNSLKRLERDNPPKSERAAILTRINSRLDAKENIIRRRLVEAQHAWRSFKKAGLPVPSFSRVYTKKGKWYLATFMEDMEKVYGKLTDVQQRGKPVLLNKLSIRKDTKLIQNLAKDLGTIYTLGFRCHRVDFWHFYTAENGKLGRVILDFESFQKQSTHSDAAHNMLRNLHDISQHMGREEFKLFMNEIYKSKFFQSIVEKARV